MVQILRDSSNVLFLLKFSSINVSIHGCVLPAVIIPVVSLNGVFCISFIPFTCINQDSSSQMTSSPHLFIWLFNCISIDSQVFILFYGLYFSVITTYFLLHCSSFGHWELALAGGCVTLPYLHLLVSISLLSITKAIPG